MSPSNNCDLLNFFEQLQNLCDSDIFHIQNKDTLFKLT